MAIAKMAKIMIELDMNVSEDLDMIERIIGSFQGPSAIGPSAEQPDAKAETALPPAEEPPAPKPKKPRRTKAEMAAARAAEAAAKEAAAKEAAASEPDLGKTEDADIDFGDFETPVDDKRTTAQWRADLVAGLNLLHAADLQTVKGIMLKYDFAKVLSLDPLKYSAVLADVQKALDATK